MINWRAQKFVVLDFTSRTVISRRVKPKNQIKLISRDLYRTYFFLSAFNNLITTNNFSHKLFKFYRKPRCIQTLLLYNTSQKSKLDRRPSRPNSNSISVTLSSSSRPIDFPHNSQLYTKTNSRARSLPVLLKSSSLLSSQRIRSRLLDLQYSNSSLSHTLSILQRSRRQQKIPRRCITTTRIPRGFTRSAPALFYINTSAILLARTTIVTPKRGPPTCVYMHSRTRSVEWGRLAVL